MMAGQSACLVHDCKPAAEIVEELVAQAQQWATFGLQEMADKKRRPCMEVEGGNSECLDDARSRRSEGGYGR